MRWAFWRRREELDCHEVARVLQAYLDQELDRGLAREVADHLDDCHRCGMEAETYRRLKASLSNLRQPVDPESVERLRRFVDDLTQRADTP